MKSNHHNRLSGILLFFIIPISVILLLSFSRKENFISRKIDNVSSLICSCPMQQEKNVVPGLTDDIVNIDGIIRYLQYYIRYPAVSLEAGHIGTVELYARVTRDGRVKEVLERPPSGNYIEIKDTIVMKILGWPNPTTESSNHARLIREGHRSLMALPRFDIPEIQEGAIKVIFRWELKNKE